MDAIAWLRSFCQNSPSAAISSWSTISLSRINASEISPALKCDLFKSVFLGIDPRNAISDRTQTSISSGAIARIDNNFTCAAPRKFAPSGSSTTPPAMVCCSDASRTTKRSPTNAKIGDAIFKCAIVFCPGSSSPFSSKATFTATRDVP